jgi:hypothetical protein
MRVPGQKFFVPAIALCSRAWPAPTIMRIGFGRILAYQLVDLDNGHQHCQYDQQNHYAHRQY